LKPTQDALELKRAILLLKKRVAQLEKAQRPVVAAFLKASAEKAAEPEKEGDATWFSSKGIVSLRKRLKLSQAKFAKLVGVSSQAVYNWERQKARAKLVLRSKTLEALRRVRDLGTRDAQAQAESVVKATPKSGKPRKAAVRKGSRHAS
ncbi:MAG: helix-turn-helix domain-containing protein, partial [Kiritimatiellia bacterium]|nr:helix-turn-helix domain-containing protein [Kiritimatiellia bacterium]